MSCPTSDRTWGRTVGAIGQAVKRRLDDGCSYVEIPGCVTSTCDAVDVASVVDDSGSPQSWINDVVNSINDIMDLMECSRGNNYRLKLITFKDDTVLRVPFSENNIGLVRAFL